MKDLNEEFDLCSECGYSIKKYTVLCNECRGTRMNEHIKWETKVLAEIDKLFADERDRI